MSGIEFQEDAATIVRPGVHAHLPDFLDFVKEACTRAELDQSAEFAVRLAVEEVCTNVIRHGYGNRDDAGPIALRVAADAENLTITIADRAPLFRPDDAAAPDMESDWELRVLGGFGWHLVRSSVDEVRHEPAAGGGNVVTLVKRISSPAINPEKTA